jgi:hypothetical protein
MAQEGRDSIAALGRRSASGTAQTIPATSFPYVGAAAAQDYQVTGRHKIGDGAAHGQAGNPVLCCKLGLTWQACTRPQSSAFDLGPDVSRNLGP